MPSPQNSCAIATILVWSVSPLVNMQFLWLFSTVCHRHQMPAPLPSSCGISSLCSVSALVNKQCTAVHSHTGCSSLTFLHCVFSNLSLNSIIILWHLLAVFCFSFGQLKECTAVSSTVLFGHQSIFNCCLQQIILYIITHHHQSIINYCLCFQKIFLT